LTTYSIQAPDGKTYRIDGPQGATQEQVQAEVMRQNPHLASAPQQAPEALRWDVLGDIGRAASGAFDALKQDASTAMSAPTSGDYGPLASLKRMGAAAKVPLDALGVVASPITGAIHGIGGSALSYTLPKLPNDIDTSKGPLGFGPTLYADPKRAADDVLDQALPLAMPSDPAAIAASAPARAATNAERTAAILRNKAIAKVNERAAQDNLVPSDIAARQQQAAANGDNLTLMDLGGKNTKGLAGAVYRAPGQAGTDIGDFLTKRDDTAASALTKDIQGGVANGSTYSAVQDLLQARSNAAGPLYKQALTAESTAPFESQFRDALQKATGAKGQIAKQIRDIDTNNPGALAARGAAGADVRARYMDLHDQLQRAESDRQAALSVFQKAQADKTANAPGATWSPRLQQFLDHPDVQTGLKNGLMQEMQDAITNNRPFKPSDYSIIGTDEAGKPIVGAVPTMKSLAVAKEALDAKVAEMRDPVTGRPTKAGLSLGKFRDAFRDELDNINPAYKAAREAWSGPTQSMEAVIDGRQHFSRTESNEQLKAEFNALSPSDKDFYRMGAAEAKVDALERAPDASDKSKRVINSERDRKRFNMLFDSPAQAQQFIDNVARKRAMFDTKNAITGNSATAQRFIEDSDNGNADMLFNGVRGIGHAAGGNILGAVKAAYDTKRALGLRNNPALNMEISKLLLDPRLRVANSGTDLLPPLPVPRKQYAISPGAAGLVGLTLPQIGSKN